MGEGHLPDRSRRGAADQFNGGRLLTTPCVERVDEDFAVIYPEGIKDAGYLSSGEFRVLEIAVSLVSELHPVPLGDVLPGLDRDALALVLAAVAHAAGAHDHSDVVPDPDGSIEGLDGRRFTARPRGSLFAWPGDDSGALTPRSQDD